MRRCSRRWSATTRTRAAPTSPRGGRAADRPTVRAHPQPGGHPARSSYGAEHGTPVTVAQTSRRDATGRRSARGRSPQDGEGEQVYAIAMLLMGENGRVVVQRVKDKSRSDPEVAAGRRAAQRLPRPLRPDQPDAADRHPEPDRGRRCWSSSVLFLFLLPAAGRADRVQRDPALDAGGDHRDEASTASRRT